MHAIATTVNDLRERPGEPGLVWGNGGYLTKHSLGVYSTQPADGGFRHDDVQVAVDALPRRVLAEPADAAGPATIEAYTVMHDREGEPEAVFAACRLGDGRRAWGTSTDTDLARAMCEGVWVGRTATLGREGALRASPQPARADQVRTVASDQRGEAEQSNPACSSSRLSRRN